MFDQPTVFVLGAGASADYGLPVGTRLVKAIYSWIGEFDPNRPDKHELRIFPTAAIGEIREMGRSLQELGETVDLFLSQHPPLRERGKYCIARLIAAHENPGWLAGKWYDQLFKRMLPRRKPADMAELSKNQVSFITFNYDRSLEEALFRKTKAYFRRSEEECAKVLASIPIIHVHGQIGRLPWQSMAGVLSEIPERKYEPDIGDPEQFAATACIKITPETERSTREYEEAQKFLLGAKRIHFLGFGFDPENLLRLKYGSGLHDDRVVSGTHHNLGESRKHEIQKSGAEFGVPVKFKDYPEMVADYMREIVGSY